MSAISEIKDAIQKKIAGQGSQVDIGNGLPSVLNGMADLIQKSQELTTKGYKLLLPVVEYNYEETPELPEAPEEGNYFALALCYEEDVMRYQIWTHNEGEDWTSVELLCIITKGDQLDQAQDLLVSNHAVKEYVNSLFYPVPDTWLSGQPVYVEDVDLSKLYQSIGLKDKEGTIYTRINPYGLITQLNIESDFPDISWGSVTAELYASNVAVTDTQALDGGDFIVLAYATNGKYIIHIAF